MGALGKYWNREWAPESEEAVMHRFVAAGVEVVLVAFDIESVIGAPPCSNDYVTALRAVRTPLHRVEQLGCIEEVLADVFHRNAERVLGL